LVCEQVIVEESTRNVTPVNCFTQRIVRRLPSAFPFVVFAILTDGSGEKPLAVVVERLDTFDEIYRGSLLGTFGSPLQEIRCLFRIRDCVFPEAGLYQISIFAEKEQVAQRKLRIVQK
jgi:hypothetical protein